MSRISFTLEDWLKDKSQKVETGEGESVSILCTNAEGVLPIIGNVGEESENLQRWTEKGQYHVGLKTPNKDLFIVTPEEELSEFGLALRNALEDSIVLADGKSDDEMSEIADKKAKRYAAELLALAREQLIKEGYVIEKKLFRDAVDKVDPEVMKEVLEDIDLSNFIHDLGERYPEVSFAKLKLIAKAAYDFGKAGVLKDLPRWKKYKKGTIIDPFALVRFSNGHIGHARFADEDCHVLEVVDLLKLPGFKKDEK